MKKKPKKLLEVRVVNDSGQRILLRTFSDGSVERDPVVELPPTERRPGPKRFHDMNKGRKKTF